jgi:manganese/zinc/iron transport system ATP- binding protein
VKIYGESLNKKRSIVAYVPQREEVDWDFPVSVVDVVLMGRYGRLPFFRRLRKDDIKVAEESLNQVGMYEMRNRQISQLSGGQQQRVFIARALAQQATVYLMDEPFAGVDAATEKAIVSLFDSLKAQGKTVVCVHHDLNTVIEYFDWTILINLRLVACGPTQQVFNAENLNSTYGGRLGLLAEVTERLRQAEWKRRAE